MQQTQRHPIPSTISQKRFQRCQEAGLVRELPAEGLASSFLGALHMEVFTAHLSGGQLIQVDAERRVRSAIECLWFGLRPDPEEE